MAKQINALSGMPISAWGEVMIEPDYVEIEFDLWFDVDEYFGTNTKSNNRWINFYTRYWPASEQVTALYTINGSDFWEEHDFMLSRIEQRKFIQIMNEYVMEETGHKMTTLWRREKRKCS